MPEAEEAELGAVLRQFREEAALSLREFATKTGYSYSHISKIERGEIATSRETMDFLLTCLGLHSHQRNQLLLQGGFGLSPDDEFLVLLAFKRDAEAAREALNSLVWKTQPNGGE